MELNWKHKLLGDHAIVFYLPEQMDTSTSSAIKNLNDYIVSQKLYELKDIIPSYHTLTLIYTIELIIDPLQFANDLIEKYLQYRKQVELMKDANRIIDVPVCYDEMFGIDLKTLSTKLNLSVNDIVKFHTEKKYQVYCLGFMPGFAYMGNLAKEIQMARHQQPRQKIVAGSVGIAGAQTGIYPINSPGGWQIIGRTPLKIFDKDPTILAKFKMGDQVKFYSITVAEFEALNEHEN